MYNKEICNKDVREYARSKGVPLYAVAMELHINDGNLSRKLRTELPEEKKAEIRTIIDDLSAGK